jgi:hypothetical protein
MPKYEGKNLKELGKRNKVPRRQFRIDHGHSHGLIDEFGLNTIVGTAHLESRPGVRDRIFVKLWR